MKIEIEVDIEGLLAQSTLHKLKSGIYPFPKEYAKIPSVRKLINKRIKELDIEGIKFIPIRRKLLKNKYWKIVERCFNATIVKYVEICSLKENDERGGRFVGNILTFYRWFRDISDIHTNKDMNIEYKRSSTEDLMRFFSLWKYIDDYKKSSIDYYYYNKNLDAEELIPLTKKEYEQKIEEISSLIRIEHEKIL